jgi:DNA-binding CsgD family transcriptional regulator
MSEIGFAPQPRIAGRERELQLLRAAVGRAADHHPSAVFVHGEAGVGKTCLVAAVCDEALELGFTVLWGRCLRFGAVESAFLPWVVALENWLAEADPAVRDRVLEAVPDAALLLPSLGGAADAAPVRLVRAAEALVSRIAATVPTVLVIDDVQWADLASRDALTYLVAGFGGQRLVVLSTYRDEDLAPGDSLHGWLADLRRLPSVAELPLRRLSRGETEEQLGFLLGGTPAPGLVTAVSERSGGNPYLTELLTEGLDPRAEKLPRALPADLANALLAAWHRLSATTRDIVRSLAVAGRPTTVNRLLSVCTATGLGSGPEVTAALTEAAHAGLVVEVATRRIWFRHPLLAEVLHETYLPGEAEPLHAAWAAELQSETGTGVEEIRRLADVALHLEGAGDIVGCLTASIAAADAARPARMWLEEAIHLQRVIALWPSVDTSTLGLNEAALLERTAVACVRVGRSADAVAAGERAVALAKAAGDKLRVSRMTTLCGYEGFWLGRVPAEPVEERRWIVALTDELPDSREHAEALAALSTGFYWSNDTEEAAKLAEAAVAAALRSGAPEALSLAYGARSMALGEVHGENDAREALRFARTSGDPDLIDEAAQHQINVLIHRGHQRDALALQRESLGWALADGATAAALWRCADLALLAADHGLLNEAADAIRTGLGMTGVRGAAFVRLAAVCVAVRRGDLAAADLHLSRAMEQMPNLEERTGLETPPVLAELLLAQRRPGQALDLLVRTLPNQAVDPRVTDLMMMWGARAAADLADLARDHGDESAVKTARATFEQLVTVRESESETPFTLGGPDDRVQPARQAIYDAEVSRLHGTTDPATWAEVADLCHQADLHWEGHLASMRHARALLASGAGPAAAAPLRKAHHFADRECAGGLRLEAEALATAARISLIDPESTDHARAPTTGPLAQLTNREREVLDHLVSGRTYAEIAAALFVSEKTVSTHVSNLLRKTGTSSRLGVSALALRLRDEEQQAGEAVPGVN